MQVKPVVPPQVASGEVTRLLGVAAGAALVTADEAGALEELPQVPKRDWHPVPQ
jgi:hypothetical protein